jgi:hypothetical protein
MASVRTCGHLSGRVEKGAIVRKGQKASYVVFCKEIAVSTNADVGKRFQTPPQVDGFGEPGPYAYLALQMAMFADLDLSRQSKTDVMSHAAEARARETTLPLEARDHTTKPNAPSPTLPKPAPAASRAAASVPRRSPSSPAWRFRSRSCFSISVALAQKIAGNARNRPPTAGPKYFATSPATTVANPPSTKRKTLSCQLLCFTADHLNRTSMINESTCIRCR